MMNANLASLILKDMKGKNAVAERSLFEKQQRSKAEFREGLRALEVKRLVERSGGEVKVTPMQKVQLAVFAIRLGAPFDKMCRYLSWQEFEQITQLALEGHGYETLRHQRFRVERRGCEIDVLGISNRIIIAVDCKHWKRALSGTVSERIALAQLGRIEALQKEKNMSKIAQALGRPLKTELMVIPVVVTLTENPMNIVNGVPVVPVLRFSSFLNEFQGYLDILSTVTIHDHRLNI